MDFEVFTLLVLYQEVLLGGVFLLSEYVEVTICGGDEVGEPTGQRRTKVSIMDIRQG